VNKIIQMIPSAFEDFREVWPCCEDTKRQICTTRIVVTVTFAHRLCVEQTREQQAALATAMYYMPYMTINDFLTGFSHYNQVIREVASSHHTLLVGGEDTIPADAKHFDDYVHFTDAGNEAMARRVTTALISSSAFRALVLDTIAVKPASASPL